MVRSAVGADHAEAAKADEEDSFAMAERLSLSPEDHRDLFDLCGEVGLCFLSTPGDPDGVDLLSNLSVSAFKVASMDLDNLPLLNYVGKQGKPLLLSTGMGTMSEVATAVETLQDAGSEEIVLLQCTSSYPASYGDANLSAMDSLKEAFDLPVGYSDHALGNAVALAAVARGACVIEKHFTLDNDMPGPDQAISAEPDDFRRLVEDIRAVEAAIGSPVKRPTDGETKMRGAFRRSIVTVVNIPAETVITEEMLAFKRPGTGISPAKLDTVLGRKAVSDIAADTILSMDHLA